MSLRGKNVRKLKEWQAPLPEGDTFGKAVIEVDGQKYINFLSIDYTLNRFAGTAITSGANRELLEQVWADSGKAFVAFKGRVSKDGKKVGHYQVFYDTEFLASFLKAYKLKERNSTNFLLPISVKHIDRILEYLGKEC
ncbi:hypothetical protein FBF91_08210 [Campylobacter upsaliensis]|uniref:hypothetical protein n=1 Tax=Campylobacter upsaliensis TaxID=28080 RepID=UPI0012D26F7E|nr:hypothetical protein [Campylobacter upsaliensis]EAK7296979.1 hypothetical protein [Campylobacter upsaliensis]MBJ6809610.1 hypothetical protein [Campylobacter upsaliensis]